MQHEGEILTTRPLTLTSDSTPARDADSRRGCRPTRLFGELGVLPAIVEALEQVGITTPFPIQAMAIPIALTGTDMIGQARTGTGKTLAFGITAAAADRRSRRA